MSLPAVGVTVQFAGIENQETIHELDLSPEVKLTPLLTDDPPRRTEAVPYAEDLLRAHIPGDDVALVVSTCTAAPIGWEVARLLGTRSGSAPVFVAVDGVPCTSQNVIDAYHSALTRYRAADRPALVTVTESALRSRPAELLDAMRAELTGLATTALLGGRAPDGLTDPIVDEVVSVSLDWLTHLVAAHNAPYTPWDGAATVLASQDWSLGGDWPGASSTRIIRVECTAEELIGAAETRATLIELASGTRATR
jgi:hypothetical protein